MLAWSPYARMAPGNCPACPCVNTALHSTTVCRRSHLVYVLYTSCDKVCQCAAGPDSNNFVLGKVSR